MKGSKSIKERENILEKCAAIFCVSEFIKKKFLEGIKKKFKKFMFYIMVLKENLKKFPKKKKKFYLLED